MRGSTIFNDPYSLTIKTQYRFCFSVTNQCCGSEFIRAKHFPKSNTEPVSSVVEPELPFLAGAGAVKKGAAPAPAQGPAMTHV